MISFISLTNGNDLILHMYFCKCTQLSYISQLFNSIAHPLYHFTPSGHLYDYELIQHTENCFLILKRLFTSFTSINDRVGTIYLMYAMYFKQPTKEYCKFRFSLNEWHELKTFYNQIHDDFKYIQVRMVFWRLWQYNAFRFVESDVEHGLESTLSAQQRSENGLSFQKITPQMLDIAGMLKDESSGLLSGLDILQAGYNEMKEHLAKFNDNCAGLRSSNMVGPLGVAIDKIENTFLAPVPRRRKRRLRGRKRTGDQSPSKTAESMDDTDDVSGSNDEYYLEGESTDMSASESERESDRSTKAIDDESDGDGMGMDIGAKRSLLKRRAMNKAARLLIHGSSYADAPVEKDDELTNSPHKDNQQSTIRRKSTPRKSACTTSDIENDETTQRATKKIEFDDQRGTVRISQADQFRKPRPLKNSIVKRQFNECPE